MRKPNLMKEGVGKEGAIQQKKTKQKTSNLVPGARAVRSFPKTKQKNIQDNDKKKRAITVLRATIGAAIVARQPQNVSNDGLLQLEETLIDFRAVAAVVVERLHQRAFFTVGKH